MILAGTPVLLYTGRLKPVEELSPGEAILGHDGRKSLVRSLVPLRSKKNILVVCGRHFLVMHHDQPVLTTYGWMRPRMLRRDDQIVTYHESGGGSAGVLWSNDQREWEGRLAKVDFRTLSIPPWPTPSLAKIARKANVLSAHVRPMLPDSVRYWTALVAKWDKLRAEEEKNLDAWRRDKQRDLLQWRHAKERAASIGERFTTPKPEPTAAPHVTSVQEFIEREKLSYTVGYFQNWCSKIRKIEERGASSMPGFDIVCDGGFVVPMRGDSTALRIICRDASPYEKPVRVAEEDDDEEDILATMKPPAMTAPKPGKVAPAVAAAAVRRPAPSLTPAHAR